MSREAISSSMSSSFSDSPWSRRPTGMPVHEPTTSAISSAETLSAIIGPDDEPGFPDPSPPPMVPSAPEASSSLATAASRSAWTAGISP
jgi:hypothetical protein